VIDNHQAGVCKNQDMTRFAESCKPFLFKTFKKQYGST
jgi:hypothetical protein